MKKKKKNWKIRFSRRVSLNVYRERLRKKKGDAASGEGGENCSGFCKYTNRLIIESCVKGITLGIDTRL